MTQKQKEAYWRDNLRLIFILLGIWGFVSFGCSILFVDWLDQFKIFNFKLGFWFAQQGAIYTFVVLIYVYIYKMKQIDKKHNVED